MKNINDLQKIAGETLEKQGGHIPQICLYGSTNKVIFMVFAGEMPSESTKRHESFRKLGYEMGRKHQTAEEVGSLDEIYFISEAWLSVKKKSEVDTNGFPKDGISPSQDPERKEALIISGMKYKTGKAVMISKEITRHQGNPTIDMKPEKPTQCQSFILEAFVNGYKAGEKDRKALN
jgi:hypothetical protein